jgi:hypothetical protein
MKKVLVLAALIASPTYAALVEVKNRYDLSGTWNEGRRLVLTYETDPLGEGVRYWAAEGEQLVEEIMVRLQITFPEASAGARNVYSSAYVDWDGGRAWHERTVEVTPLVADCNGAPCRYEGPTYIGSTGMMFSLFPWELIEGGGDLAGRTFDVSLLVSPTSYQPYTHTAYNSRTVETLGPSYYSTYISTTTTWEMDNPEAGTWGLVGVGVVGLGLFRKKRS